jgi:predicted RNase H-like HicB family nuclease
MKYLVIFEKSRTGYGAYAPDLPGCVAVAKSLPETKKLMREAIELHIESLREHGDPVPEPVSRTEYVNVSA